MRESLAFSARPKILKLRLGSIDLLPFCLPRECCEASLLFSWVGVGARLKKVGHVYLAADRTSVVGAFLMEIDDRSGDEGGAAC